MGNILKGFLEKEGSLIDKLTDLNIPNYIHDSVKCVELKPTLIINEISDNLREKLQNILINAGVLNKTLLGSSVLMDMTATKKELEENKIKAINNFESVLKENNLYEQYKWSICVSENNHGSWFFDIPLNKKKTNEKKTDTFEDFDEHINEEPESTRTINDFNIQKNSYRLNFVPYKRILNNISESTSLKHNEIQLNSILEIFLQILKDNPNLKIEINAFFGFLNLPPNEHLYTDKICGDLSGFQIAISRLYNTLKYISEYLKLNLNIPNNLDIDTFQEFKNKLSNEYLTIGTTGYGYINGVFIIFK